MLQSIYSGVSGLQSFQTGIDVLANNIANVNSVGFKGSRTEFSNLFEKTLSSAGGGPVTSQVGIGTRVSATALDMRTGGYSQTDRNTDLSIQGEDGWFGVLDSNNNISFTRAGNFGYDAYNTSDLSSEALTRLVNPEGLFVAGVSLNNFAFDPTIPYGDSLSDKGAYVLSDTVNSIDLGGVDAQGPIELPLQFYTPAIPTTDVSFFANLGIENIIKTMSAEVISVPDQRNTLKLSFEQTVPQPATGLSWDITATVASRDYNPAQGIGTLYDTQTGVVTFDTQGGLISPPPVLTLDNDGTSVNVHLDGTEFAANGTPVTTNVGPFGGVISSFGQTFSTSSQGNGNPGGELTGYNFTPDGEIIAMFSNGHESRVGKVAIYHFQNDQGLEAISGNRFIASSNSGDPVIYEKNNGQIYSRKLENSNVTLETALTELIIMQRSYDATAKTITTSDQMLKNALQM